MTAAGSTTSPWYRGFRIAVFTLLACDTAYYLYAGTLSKGLDASAWLALLALFMLETGFANHVASPRATVVMRAARLTASAGVCIAGVGYVMESDKLDAVNSALWIAVVILLELEVRRPLEVARHRNLFTAAAALLYAGLGALVIAWARERAWLDAYDALLWLIAFATIEMDVLKATRQNAAA